MKHAASSMQDNISCIDPQRIANEILTSKNNIEHFSNEIANVFVELGYTAHASEVKITIGPELELTQVAGNKSWARRVKQIDKQRRQSGSTFNLNSKDDSYMPATAQVAYLNEQFDVAKRLGRPASQGILVELEPAFKTNLGTRLKLSNTPQGMKQVQAPCAFSQIEFTSPPRSPIGAAAWINKIMDNAVNAVGKLTPDGHKKYGIKLLDFTARPHDETAPNSIHLNSVIQVGGKNAFSAHEWEQGNTIGVPSDLLLCVGQAHMEYLKHSLFMFARAESDYARFHREEITGPTFIAIPPRKKHGEFSSAMFRGEKRQTERSNSAYPDKKDQGPLRLELRVPCPGAAGHPNKSAYPEQNALAYQMIEAYMHMLYNGVQRWKQRELARRAGQPLELLQEQMFFPTGESMILPAHKSEALHQFISSAEARAYWGDRISLLCELSAQLDSINAADRNPYGKEKGAHIHRR